MNLGVIIVLLRLLTVTLIITTQLLVLYKLIH